MSSRSPSPRRERATRVVGPVLWHMRYDLLAVVVVAVAMGLLAMVLPLQSAAAIVPLIGVVVSIFIGFRNSNAYARWWEARTLWGTVVGNGRALSNALTAVTDPDAGAAEVADRMRRRQVREAWQLAAELQGRTPPAAVAELTPEDPSESSSDELLELQARDINEMTRAGMTDAQGRTVLVNLNTAQIAAVTGLQRIRSQAIPRYYDVFIRGLAWFFAILVCTRVDSGGHGNLIAILPGILIMSLFILAERLGHLLEQPLSGNAFSLPMDEFCAVLTADLLGTSHPLLTDARVSG